ncbi:MAG: phage portal protein, partial [Akkermansiaceae bacterium]|nr:phage portal protein [Akkermansiaceae bacterium]
EEDMKAKPLSMSAEDAQLLQTRAFQVREVATWLGLPPHKVGDETRTSFASLEQENQAFLSDSIDPWLVMIEDELEAKLLTTRENEDETHAIEFTRQALLRADVTARSGFYQVMRSQGIMTTNEVRSRENLDPVDGGDTLLVPLNVQNIPADEEPPAKPPADDRLARAVECTVREAAARLCRRVMRSATRAAKDPGRFLERVDALEADHLEVAEQILGPSVAVALVATDRSVKADAVARVFLDTVRAELLSCAEAKPNEIAERVKAWAREWEPILTDTLVEEILGGSDE